MLLPRARKGPERPETPKRRKGVGTGEPSRPGKAGVGSRRPGSRLALTSGQAARYCLVSPDTIVHWIASGHLKSQRTAGGQHRIRVEDLREFMVERGMRTDELVAEMGFDPLCWEFWTLLDGNARKPARHPDCTTCPVYRSQAAVCHEVRPLLPGGTLRAPACTDCIFFASVRDIHGDEK